MSSKTEIANLALLHLGSSEIIANIETEKSQKAMVCRKFYDISRDATLRDYAWPFAITIAALGLVEENPTDEWLYSYRYPQDCARALRILSGVRVDTADSRVKYKIVDADDGGHLIYTDQEDAELEYVKQMTDITKYPPDFIMAISFRLAAYIAPSVTAGDPNKLGERAIKMYAYEGSKAESSGVNEEQGDLPPESEFIRFRE